MLPSKDVSTSNKEDKITNFSPFSNTGVVELKRKLSSYNYSLLLKKAQISEELYLTPTGCNTLEDQALYLTRAAQ